MDWLRNLAIVAALATFAAQGSAYGQTRAGLFARGVGSTAAQGSASISGSGSPAVFVAPKVGVGESARAATAWGERRYDAASSAVKTTSAFAEPETDATVADEKARAAAILDDMQERAAKKARRATKNYDVPMTLGVLKDKPSARHNAPGVANSVRQSPAPQYLQYSPASPAAQAPRAFRLPENAGANPDSAAAKQFGRTQAPVVQAPLVLSAADETVDLGLASPNAPAVPDALEQASYANSGAAPSPADVENAVSQDVDSLRLDEFESIAEQVDSMENSVADAVDSLGENVVSSPLNEENDAQPALAIENDGNDPLPALNPEEPALELEPETPTVQTAPTLDEMNVVQEGTTKDAANPTLDDSNVEFDPIPVDPIPVQPILPPADVDVQDKLPPVPETLEFEDGELDANETNSANEIKDGDVPKEEQDAKANEQKRVEENAKETAEQNEPPKPDAAPQAPTCSYDFANDVRLFAAPTVAAQPSMNPAVARLSANQCVAQPNAPVFASVAPQIPRPCAPKRVYGVMRSPTPGGGATPFSSDAYPGDPASNWKPSEQNARPVYSYESGCCEASSRPVGLFGGAEWLYWTADADASYARATNEFGGLIEERDLETSGSGLRGRIGARFASGCEIVGTYTRFESDENGGFNASELPSGAALTSPLLGAGVAFNDIRSTLKTELQVVDVELGRWADCNAFSFRPFAGVRWTQLNEETKDVFAVSVGDPLLDTLSIYDGTFENEAAMSAVGGSNPLGQLRAKSRLNAYGLRLGADVAVELAQGFSVFGKGAGTIAAGEVKSQTFYSGIEGAYAGHMRKRYATPSVEGLVGISWKSARGFEVRGGYEFNAWYNASQTDGRKKDFLARGCFAGIGWNY